MINMSKAKIFYGENVSETLTECYREKYRPLNMPELLRERIKSTQDNTLWNGLYTTNSIRVTGTTQKGSKVVVYSHSPDHYLSNPDCIKEALQMGIHKGGNVIIPRSEFYALIDKADGINTFAVDGDLGNQRLDQLFYAHAGPFLGSKELVEKYFKNTPAQGRMINIPKPEFKEDPLASFLFVGGAHGCSHFGISYIQCAGRYVGVSPDFNPQTDHLNLSAQVQRSKSSLAEIIEALDDRRISGEEAVQRQTDERVKREKGIAVVIGSTC